VVTVRTASLTFTNSTFCPHGVFRCFVWISEQTAIIPLYSINWLIFITETESVYCAVRTGSLCMKQICFVFKGLMTCRYLQAVSRRPLIADARVRSQVTQCEICGGQSGIGTRFSPSTPVSPVSIIPPMLHTHSAIYHRRYTIAATNSAVK
jgi:hypothetical protein